ncbi:helix-turn-helix transcriptional regulator [Streptomyces sp. NPDC005728]|uniref:AraC family transcriptional regulator n=1 Tax=Streptomyces sp. NPDC005728 TaxID=3157054 RepID=UPI003400DE3D
MVDFASLPIPVVPYTPICRPGPGIAISTLSDLRERAPLGLLAAPHRLDFHQIMLVTTGQGTYAVDSACIPCSAGTLLWTRPNQVIQSFPGDMDGELLMFTEAFPLPMHASLGLLDDVLRPSHWQLSDTELAFFQQVLTLLQAELRRSDRGTGEQVLKHLLAVVLLRVDEACRLRHEEAAAPSGETDELFVRFRQELEGSYRSTRLVEDYAARLSCSTRALSRACRAAGTSAKDVIDARVALEARRLLLHTDLSIAAIARHLGFSEVTNFGKFFVRRVNMTPGAFRRDGRTRHQPESRDSGERFTSP